MSSLKVIEVQNELERFQAQFEYEALKFLNSSEDAKQVLENFLTIIRNIPLCYWLQPQVKSMIDTALSSHKNLETMMLTLACKYFAASNSSNLVEVLSSHIAQAMQLDGPDTNANLLREELSRNMPTNLLQERFKQLPWYRRIFLRQPNLQTLLKNNKLYVILALVYVVEPEVKRDDKS